MNALYDRYATVYDRTGQSRFGLRMVRYARTLWALSDRPVHRVLDVACGTGSAAIALARRGYAVTGVDSAPRMLEIAHAKAARWKADVAFLQQDMRELAVDSPFDAATCFYDSLNYMLVPEDLVRAFTRIREHLVPGGLLVCDLITDHGISEIWGDATEARTDTDWARIWKSRYDWETGIGTLETDTFVREEGDRYQRIHEIHRHRGYSVFDVRAALEAAGLEFMNAYQCLTLKPTTPTSYRVAYLARRPGA